MDYQHHYEVKSSTITTTSATIKSSLSLPSLPSYQKATHPSPPHHLSTPCPYPTPILPKSHPSTPSPPPPKHSLSLPYPLLPPPPTPPAINVREGHGCNGSVSPCWSHYRCVTGPRQLFVPLTYDHAQGGSMMGAGNGLKMGYDGCWGGCLEWVKNGISWVLGMG
ncbi:hypothetical protein Pmani_028299 [Petrolisthes manimaculis]|uniref:Uncharacterized protein n=1 Tax=Petrolisthes manimaculis TaxID=1843537 RepID=A0AAE1P117_9EUCA|nr:hypothetical protein Pmani_028299 [Petrolisthes manimaculis]